MASAGEVSRIIFWPQTAISTSASASTEELESYTSPRPARYRRVPVGAWLWPRQSGRRDRCKALAQNGNGTAAYIDTLSEAQKVLVDQLTGALFPIADGREDPGRMEPRRGRRIPADRL
jgi:Ca-activated chloride channel family protein